MIPDKERRVVIVGGGFAGTTIARALERRLTDDWDVYLLTPTSVLTYNPLLPEVVGGALLPGHAAAPIRLMLSRTRIRMVAVKYIDPQAKRVDYQGVQTGSLHYDHLVIAVGVTASLGNLPGMATHALPLKTLGDALHLRNTILRRMEEATLTRHTVRRRSLMTFVVIGGGFSGVETAGEIFDLITSSRRYYRNVERSDLRVVILHAGPVLLPDLPESLGRYACATLAQRGVEVRLSTRATRIEATGVYTDRGEHISAGTVISTIGTTPHDFVAHAGLPTLRGRLTSDSTLRVRGHDDIWAVGDCAIVPNADDGADCPPTAQFAVRQARQAADNIVAVIEARSPQTFSYRALGQFAPVGHRKAVAEILGIKLRGLSGWLLWRALYLSKLPTLSAQVRVFFEWTWALCFPRDPGILDFSRTLPPSATEAGAQEIPSSEGHAAVVERCVQPGG